MLNEGRVPPAVDEADAMKEVGKRSGIAGDNGSPSARIAIDKGAAQKPGETDAHFKQRMEPERHRPL
jgi:hypothetical protein